MVDCTFSEGAQLPKSEHNFLLLQILTRMAECADLAGLAATGRLLLYHGRQKQ